MEITNGTVVRIREKKGVRYILVPHTPTEAELALCGYLADLGHRVAAAMADCREFIHCLQRHPHRFASLREGRLDALLLAPRSKGSRTRFSERGAVRF